MHWKTQRLIGLFQASVLCAFLTASLGHAQIRIGVTGNHSNPANQKAAKQACESGDLDCTYTELDPATFNAMTPAEFRANFDVLLASWMSQSWHFDLDWDTKLLPFLELGGGIIWEDPGNSADLDPAVAALNLMPFNTDWCGVLITEEIQGVTTGILQDGECTGNQRPACFSNYHVGFSSWHPNLSPFLLAKGTRYMTDGSEVPDEECQPNLIIGLHGEFSGGRIILSGPDNNFHGVRDDGELRRSRNQYKLLVNELLWVAEGFDPPPPDDDTFPPVVSITSPAHGAVFEPGSSFTVHADASDNVGVASVTFRLDGVTQCIETESPYTCQMSVSETPDTAHEVSAMAVDAAGNSATDSITVHATLDADNTPPQVAITSPNDGELIFVGTSFTAIAEASDNVGVTHVVFRRNGVSVCTVFESPYTCEIAVGNQPNVDYQISATAFDAAGNSATDAIIVTTYSDADTEPPVVIITWPADGQIIEKGSTFTVEAEATDNVGVTDVVFRLNGQTKCVDSTAPYTCQMTIDNTPDAAYEIVVTAFDAANNSASDSVTFFSSSADGDTTPPNVAITHPADGASVPVSKDILVQADASDDVGVASVEFRLNGDLKCIDTTAPYSCQMSIGRRAGLTYYISAMAFDAAGNSAEHTISVISVEPDTMPPTVLITSPADGAVIERGSTFIVEATATDNVGVTNVVFRLNDETKCVDSTSPYTCQMTIDDTPDAAYQITAIAFDAANNSSSHTITVFSSPEQDTTPPSVVITYPADGAFVQAGSNITVEASASDNIGVASVEFRLNGALQCTDTQAPYSCQMAIGASPGVQYTIMATAFDAAGNSASHSITVTSASEADTTPPTVAITSPLDGAVVQRGTTITVEADASDNVGVASVVFRLDGVIQCTDTQAPYSCQVSIPSKPNQPYVISATAFDAAGNSASHEITVVSSGSGNRN
jgi:hypothetical protein